MKTPIIVGSSGLSALSLVVLSACSTDSKRAPEEAEPIISVAISATEPLENIQKLSLQFSPSHIYAPCDGDSNDEYNPHVSRPVTCWPSNIRVFTNGDGQNHVVEPTGDCHTETVRVPMPANDPENPNALADWQAAGGEYREQRVCTEGGASESILTLINTLEANALPTSYIARDNRFVEGTFSRIIVQAWGVPNRDDSYADLIDGRRCEVNVIFPNDIDPNDIQHYANFHLPTFTIQNGEKWLVDLKFDFGGTAIDPARCAEGLDLFVTPGSATVRRIEE